MKTKATATPGKPPGKYYYIQILMDGQMYWMEKVRAVSAEAAAARAFCQAMTTILDSMFTAGTPAPPSVESPPGAEQLPLPADER